MEIKTPRNSIEEGPLGEERNLNPLERGLHYKNYLDFLRKREELSSNDLELLAKNFSIPIEKLNQVREEIRKRIFNQTESSKSLALVTTYHLIPWELEYYFLASRRIDLLGKSIFSMPIVYMDPRDEGSFFFTIGDKRIDLRSIFDFSSTPKIETSYDFYFSLKSKFLEFLGGKEDFNGDFRSLVDQNLNLDDDRVKTIINQKLKNLNLISKKEDINISKEDINKIYSRLVKEIFYLLADFFNFFEGKSQLKLDDSGLSLKERWTKIKETFDYLFENEDIKPLIEKLEIYRENANYSNNSYNKLIFLLLILGGINHIGAEWTEEGKFGKYNQIRQSLGLSVLPDVPPGVFVERFRIMEHGRFDSLSLRLLFGDLSNIWYAASIQGKNVGGFSPLSEKVRKKIRLIDFYFRYKKILSKLNEDKLELSVETIKDIFKKYFERFLKDKVDQSTFEKINKEIEEFFEGKQGSLSLAELVNEFNQESSDRKNHIWLDNLKLIIIELALPSYINFQGKSDNEVLNLFLNVDEDIEKLELQQSDLGVGDFGGIELPIKLPSMTSDDLLMIYYLSSYLEGQS